MKKTVNEKITFCIPSKNNRRYLEACIPSIRKNAYRPDHDIIVFVDEDNDGTVEWLESVKEDYNLRYIVNDTGELYGIGKAYDKCVEESTTDIFMIFHADMMLGRDADYHALKYLERKKVVCSTRIEPPLHPEGPEKIVKDFGMWPEKDIEDGWRDKDFDVFTDIMKEKNEGKITKGCFAPWMMYKDEFLEMGGHDFRFKSAREDSDVFNRLVLSGFELIQSWQSYVYHLTARAGMFQDGNLKKQNGLFQDGQSKEWQKLMHNSTYEFVRKWGSIVRHDKYMLPIIWPKYDIGFVIKNCNNDLLRLLEPWCSTIYVDCQTEGFIDEVQPHTTVNLSKKVLSIHSEKQNDIIIRFDANNINNESFSFIQQLPLILEESGEIGDMKHDIFEIKINSLKTYNEELIKCHMI